jgi:hypothetical protein
MWSYGHHSGCLRHGRGLYPTSRFRSKFGGTARYLTGCGTQRENSGTGENLPAGGRGELGRRTGSHGARRPPGNRRQRTRSPRGTDPLNPVAGTPSRHPGHPHSVRVTRPPGRPGELPPHRVFRFPSGEGGRLGPTRTVRQRPAPRRGPETVLEPCGGPRRSDPGLGESHVAPTL